MTKSTTTILVNGVEIALFKIKEEDFVCISDMAGAVGGESRTVIANWMRNRNTVQFLGTWEKLNNNGFFNIEVYEQMLYEAGSNVFTLSPSKWIKETNAKGIVNKMGRGGGTYAHKDIALGFCYYLSPEFQLYVIQEFQRLKEDEAQRSNLEWNVHRVMTKANHRILTEAIREHLVPPRIQHTRHEGIVFANEADLINMALFGMTAKQWRTMNPEAKGNQRDNATKEQLLVLSNLQSLNSKLMEWGCGEEERLEILNSTAIQQMNILLTSTSLNQLPSEKQKRLKKGKK